MNFRHKKNLTQHNVQQSKQFQMQLGMLQTKIRKIQCFCQLFASSKHEAIRQTDIKKDTIKKIHIF